MREQVNLEKISSALEYDNEALEEHNRLVTVLNSMQKENNVIRDTLETMQNELTNKQLLISDLKISVGELESIIKSFQEVYNQQPQLESVEVESEEKQSS